MATPVYIPTKTLPETLRGVLHSLGCGAADLRTEVGASVSYPHAYGAGFRARCVVVNLASGESREEVGSWGGPNPFAPAKLDAVAAFALPAGFVVLTSTDSGRYWTLHLHPDNAAPLLPAPASISPRERWILYSFRALTSAGRKNEFARAGKGAPTAPELAALAARGFLKINRAGAAQITTEGKNAIAGVNHAPYAAPEAGAA
jgi:hypothetical protein